MKKIKVGCFFGGRSAEYSVSLVSATAIIKSIDTTRYEIVMIGIDDAGSFYHYEGNPDDIEVNRWKEKAKKLSLDLLCEPKARFKSEDGFVDMDIAFPILHGTNGEDGRLQGLFELLNIKVVGCDMASSSLAMDKYASKLLVEQHGIDSAKSVLITIYDDKEKQKDLIQNLELPLFIKPLKAGSSFGISKISNLDDFDKALKEAFIYDDKIIVEETIDGFEVGCAIIGNEELIIGAVDEIELHTDFFNFEEKYQLTNSTIHLPARLTVSEMQRIQETAKKIYRILGCRGCARVDLFYTKDKKIIFNEVNTMPGFTAHSRFPNMLKAVGYTFEHVISDLIELGLNHD